MQPKFLILKFYSKSLFEKFVQTLSKHPHIFFYSRKFNGTYNVIIKTQIYFKKILQTDMNFKFCTSYIYLYTTISLIVSEFIIDNFEIKLAHQILSSKYRYLKPYMQSRLKNIVDVVLDSNYPNSTSKKLFLYRRNLILNKLLLNFRKSNYLYIEHFAYFKLPDYHLHLENVISKTYSRY